MARLEAAEDLRKWLEAGGPLGAPGGSAAPSGSAGPSGRRKATRKAAGATGSQAAAEAAPGPFVLVSERVALGGEDGNVALCAVRAVEPGELLLGVARACVLQPRSAALGEARRAVVERAAAVLREALPPTARCTPFLNTAAEGWAELVALLALELLQADESAWWPYLRTLPQKEAAAPPSLWAEVFGAVGEAAVGLLDGTSIGASVAHDAQTIGGFLRTAGSKVAQLLGTFAGQSAEVASDALLRALALVSTRAIDGLGMAPFIDLVNGSPTGRHNATFERTNLARSAEAPAQPCIALVASSRIAEGEEILAAYGLYSAADFLYRYGWLEGGPGQEAAAASPHDTVGLPAAEVWATLSVGQKAVLTRHGLGLQDLEEDLVCGTPFAMPVAEASEGLLPDLLRQVALIACCSDEVALRELAETGRTRDGKGVTAQQVAQRAAEWVAAHVRRLSAEAAPAANSVQGRLALRLRRGERERLLRWMMGLQNKQKLPKDLWAGAMRYHVAACKGQVLPATEE